MPVFTKAKGYLIGNHTYSHMKLTKKKRERLLSYFGYYIVYTKNKIGGIVCTEINENKQSANKKVKQKKTKCYSSWVFHDVSFVFVKGKKYAVAGANGSGKTTLINIIAGLLQGFDGDVLYDESSITDLSRESVTGLVSVVTQDAFLFNDTIRNNISLFKKVFLMRAFSRHWKTRAF